MNHVVGIIGYGNMGSAIAERTRKIRYRVVKKIKVLVYDKDSHKTEKLKNTDVAKDIGSLVQHADTVILAVKPQDFDNVLNEMKTFKRPGSLVISVAAGITAGYIEKVLGDVEVVRVMPNLPAKIGKGMTALCKGRFTSTKKFDWAKQLFRSLGVVLTVEEKMMSAVTAVSGSGPAYVCRSSEMGEGKNHFLQEFKDAAKKVGFDKIEASLLINTTYSGTIAFLKQTKTEPKELIKQVASKGGTTEAALAVLQGGGSLEEAVLAAKKRAEELCL